MESSGELSQSLKQGRAVVIFERPRQRLLLWREQHGELMETVEGNTVGTRGLRNGPDEGCEGEGGIVRGLISLPLY